MTSRRTVSTIKKASPARSKTKAARRIQAVLDEAQKNCIPSGISSWFTRLPKGDQRWLEDLKKEYLAGRCKTISREALSKAISKELGITVSSWSIRTWIARS